MAALRGVEGAAAATYFGAYAELCPPRYQFSHRNRRPPKDPINAVLSLGYTLLHAEAVLAAYGAGIDPFIGFYHALDFGRESLACDIVEPLRADVDSHTLNLFRSEILRTDDFSFNNDACLMGKAGRVRFYTEWQRVAEGLRKKLEEQVSDLTQLMARNEPVSKVVACSSTANTERPADLS